MSGAGEVQAAVAVLRRGGLVAFPTETVYGLGADAGNPDAVRRIFAVKGRPPDHPLIVHLASSEQLGDWGRDIPDEATALARALWPGPLTLVVRRSARVPDVVTGGRDTVGLRVPAHPLALELLAAFGGGVAAPSANRFGRVSPTTADDVRADLGADVDLVLDGGPCAVGVESTIVDLTGARPEILRPGGVTAEQVAAVLHRPPALWSGTGEARAPGMLAAHYAPRARVLVVAAGELAEHVRREAASGGLVGVLAPTASAAATEATASVVELEPAGDAEHYAQVLYARLRQADRLGIEVLLVVPPDDGGIGSAVRDRLARAAASSG